MSLILPRVPTGTHETVQNQNFSERARCDSLNYRILYSVSYPVEGCDERTARPVGPAERGPEVRPATARGVRGPDGRGLAAERRPGVHDPAAAGARRPGGGGQRRTGGERSAQHCAGRAAEG